jgi:hypothetical protein
MKGYMKYKIVREQLLPKGKHRKFTEEVEGEPFLVPDWEEFKFFKRTAGTLVIISEVTTGMQVGVFYRNESEARRDVKNRLKQAGIDRIRKIIAENQMAG